MPRDGETIDPEWRLYARSAGDDKAPIRHTEPLNWEFVKPAVRSYK